MQDATHDGLREYMEQVGADREDALHARAHQRRRNDETAAGTDAAGNQAGDNANRDRGHEDGRGVVGRPVGLLAAEDLRQRRTEVIGESDTDHGDGKQKQAKHSHSSAVANDPLRGIDVPLRVVLRAGHHQVIELPKPRHDCLSYMHTASANRSAVSGGTGR
jgi:hypothetical protein